MRTTGMVLVGRMAFTGLCTLALCGPSTAQKSGTRLDRNRGAVGSISSTDPATATRAANMFAQCVARREGRSVRRALDLPFGSPEQSAGIRRQMDNFDGCLGTATEFDQMSLPAVLLAGGAAEWFVRTELKNVDISPLQGVSDEALAQSQYRPRTDLEDLSLCVIRRNVQNAKSLIATVPTSAMERAAFQKIVPDISPCVTAESTLKLNIPNVRAIIAYGLYRASSQVEAPRA